MGGTRPAARTSGVLAAVFILHVVALAVFVNGFLLTRVHLENRSQKLGSVCDAPYTKLVWIVIDALRWVSRRLQRQSPCSGCPCVHAETSPRPPVFPLHPPQI